MSTLDFKASFLGQSVIKYQVPLSVYDTLNNIYENKFHKLRPANHALAGKIEKEHSLYFNGTVNNKLTKHSVVPQDILNWFNQMFGHYLEWNNIADYQMNLNSIWINEMKEHEYNPIHTHQGSLHTGLSSVMILKLPKDTGVEYSAAEAPTNGGLQILGNLTGQFAKVDYQPFTQEGEFYIFPYDMRHCVYPFNGPGLRRTLAANMDVKYNPFDNSNKGAS